MNLNALKALWQNRNLRKRVLVVLGLIVIFRLLAHVPVPVPNNLALTRFLNTLFNSNRLLGFADLFSGGALTNFSIVMMGVGPYITASIIIQLLTKAVPRFESLSKEGESGRRTLNQYTRLLSLPLAMGQSVAMILLVQQTSKRITQSDLIGQPSILQWALMITSITAGSMLLMWLGELITEKGVGNGVSLIIFAGIVGRLPQTIGQYITLAAGDTTKMFTVGIFLALALLAIAAVVLLNEAQRNIPVSYARRMRGSKTYAGVDTHLPLRLIMAGVIPIIFALAFLSVPGVLGQIFANAKSQWVVTAANNLNTWFQPTGRIYAISYFVLVFTFTYFYTAVVFNPKEIAENLQKQGGFVPGIRPGKETSTYLKKVISRLTLSGAVGLGALAVMPFVVQEFTRSQSLTLGGTGLLIVVSVAIETMKQVESQTISAAYEKY